ncbi:MAG: hypothetical protein WC328_05260, partial [Kiritimatiellia bacterium]
SWQGRLAEPSAAVSAKPPYRRPSPVNLSWQGRLAEPSAAVSAKPPYRRRSPVTCHGRDASPRRPLPDARKRTVLP